MERIFKRSIKEVPHPIQVDPHKLSLRAQKVQRYMESKLVDQPRAIKRLVKVYERFLSNMNDPTRPVEVLMFLGPTGSGKTRAVEVFSEAIFGRDVTIKIDCAEFRSEHEIAKLGGSPPGYVGSGKETAANARITNEKLRAHYAGVPGAPALSIVLFDEIERGNNSLHMLLYGIMDKGTLTLGNGEVVDFRRTVIVFTSNLGSKELDEVLSNTGIGFVRNTQHTSDTDHAVYQVSTGAAKRFFEAPFIGRVDRMVVFRPLNEDALRKILDIELDALQEHLKKTYRYIMVKVSDDAKEFLLHEGFKKSEGARHLKKSVQRFLKDPIASLIASLQVASGDFLYAAIDPGDDELSFSILPGVVDIQSDPMIVQPKADEGNGNVGQGSSDYVHTCLVGNDGLCMYCLKPMGPCGGPMASTK